VPVWCAVSTYATSKRDLSAFLTAMALPLLTSGHSNDSSQVPPVSRRSSQASFERDIPDRERADIADLERHLTPSRVSWIDDRSLPPLPHLNVRSKSFTDAEEANREGVVAESRQLRQPGGFRRGHVREVAHAQGLSSQVSFGGLVARIQLGGIVLEMSQADAWRFESETGCINMGLPIRSPDGQDAPHVAHQMGNSGIFISLVKGHMGSGVLFQARAFMSGGYGLMTFILPAMAVTAVFGGLRLVKTRDFVDCGSYGELMVRAFGRPGRMAVNTSIFLLEVLACCSYMGLLANTLKKILSPHAPTWAYVFGSLVLFVPLALFRNMKKLAPVSVIGVITLSLSLSVVLCEEIGALSEKGVHLDELAPVRADGVLLSLGIACFCFEGIPCLLPIYNTAKDKASFPFIYASAVACVTVCNVVIGLLGYLAFGEKTESFILLNLPQGIGNQIVEILYLMSLLCTFPMVFLPAVRIVEDILFGLPTSNPAFALKCRKNVFRLLFVTIMACITLLAASSLDHFVSLAGAFCGLPVAFVYPALVHWGLHPGLTVRDRLLDGMMIVIGLVLTFSITAYCIATWGSA